MPETLEFETTKIGTVQYREDQVYELPCGLFGFEEETSFILLQTDNVKPFYWFQSLTTSHLAFLLCDPKCFLPDYTLKIKREDIAEIELESADDSFIYTIITVPDDPKKMTANLQGPLIFNLKNRKVKQIVNEGADLRYPLFPDSGSD